MKKKNTTLIALILFLVFIFIICTVPLFTNKTFFKTTYIGVNNQEIFIPRFSYFNNVSGHFVAGFKSLKSKKQLEEEIENYMKDFEYFNDFEDGVTDKDKITFGYKKGDLFIQSYIVIDEIFFRRIFITY